MKTFGDPAVFAFRVGHLAGPPPEADPAAARTWASLQIFVEGRNLCVHTHEQRAEVDDGLHWPLVALARWLVRSWALLFEEQRWPLAGHRRNAKAVCAALDRRLLEREDAGASDDELDPLVDERDAFVAAHSLAAAAAGGLVPDVYLARDGGRVSVSWGAGDLLPGVWFHLRPDEADVPAAHFVDAARGLVGWTLDCLRGAPECAADAALMDAWLTYATSHVAAEAALEGYVGVRRADAPPAVWQRLLALCGLEEPWADASAGFDPSQLAAAVAFRGMAPQVPLEERVALLETLRAYPRSPAPEKLVALCAQASLASLHDARDYEQGYALAIRVRSALQNPADYLDVEGLLHDLGVPVTTLSLIDVAVDGASVWGPEQGPVVAVNGISPRGQTAWGRRMVLAHELCHLLVDRTAAGDLLAVSSPWAPPIAERRANAFAAELLLPKRGVLQQLGAPDQMPEDPELKLLMDTFGVGLGTCTQHLRNRFRLRD